MIIIYIIQCVMIIIPLFIGICVLVKTILDKDKNKEHIESSFFIQNNDDDDYF